LKALLQTLLLFAVGILSGCKLVVVVPEGGKVVTESGAYTCSSGKSCKIPVVDFFFKENFIAMPDEDYIFYHWGKATKHLCGKGTGSCELSTELFEEFPALVALLESDKEFYIRPIFLKKEDFGREPANICFNAEAYKKGTRSTLRILTTLSLGPASVEIHQDVKSIVDGLDSFEGRSGTKISTEGTRTTKWPNSLFPFPDQTEIISGASYQVINFDAPATKQIGSIFGSEATKPEGLSFGFYKTYTEISFKPGLRMRYNLAAGDSYEFANKSFIHNETWDIDGIGHEVKDYEEDTNHEVIYRGIEIITVPAGTYRACRFEKHVTKFPEGSGSISLDPVIEWYGVGSGVLIKQESSGPDGFAVTKLLSATINGVSVVGIQ
jgi:hypothetical protein